MQGRWHTQVSPLIYSFRTLFTTSMQQGLVMLHYFPFSYPFITDPYQLLVFDFPLQTLSRLTFRLHFNTTRFSPCCIEAFSFQECKDLSLPVMLSSSIGCSDERLSHPHCVVVCLLTQRVSPSPWLSSDFRHGGQVCSYGSSLLHHYLHFNTVGCLFYSMHWIYIAGFRVASSPLFK